MRFDEYLKRQQSKWGIRSWFWWYFAKFQLWYEQKLYDISPKLYTKITGDDLND